MTKDKSILINNIYHMLSYAFQTLNQETYDDVAVESFDEMYNLLAAILAKGIGLQLKQGLYREYISRQEELPVMRGKINMPGTIKNKLAHERVLTCDFDELSENNTLNQILKTTVMLLLRNGKVQEKYKDDLKKKMLYFSNVDVIEPCGDCGGTTQKGYVEILEFTHFVEFFSFNKIGENHRKKELVRKVTVVVALDLGCGNTKNSEYESK